MENSNKIKNTDRVIKQSKVKLLNSDYTYITVSDIGNSRTQNQDSFVSISFEVNSKTYLLSFVCDGMGGHEDGLEASLTVKNTLIETLQNSKIKDEESLIRVVESAIREANKTIFVNHSGRSGTTAVGILYDGETTYWWNIGDSRLYQLKGGEVLQVSKDHSLMQQELDSGNLKPEDIKTYKLTNLLTRAMGSSESIELDSGVLNNKSNLVLCSDGFWHHIEPKELKQVISSDSTSELICDVINKIMSRGEKDNITAIVIKEDKVKDN